MFVVLHHSQGLNNIFFQGNPAFLEAVERELPTKTAEEIREHEQWFAEFTTLLNSKKAAIEAWKEDKQVHLVSPNPIDSIPLHFRF